MFKRETSKYFSYSFVLLGYVTNCFSLNNVSAAEIFERAFNGASPFYAITVARDTVAEPYGPLAEEEVGIVFSALEALLSGNPSRFLALSEKKIREKETWYLQTQERLRVAESELDPRAISDLLIEAAADSFVKVPLFRAFLGFADKADREVCKAKLKDFIFDNIGREAGGISLDAFREHLRGYFAVPTEKASNPVFETKSEEILKFIRTYHQEVEKKKSDMARRGVFSDPLETTLFESYASQIWGRDPGSFFRGVFENIQRIAELSQTIATGAIQVNPCLIVFNEMFFSKSRPLSSEEFTEIEKLFKSLTESFPSLLVHTNFLFETALPFPEMPEYQDFIAEQARRAEELSARTEKQIFESNKYESYGNYAAQFADYKSPLNTLINQSLVFWNGDSIMSYLKSSYKTEADGHLTGKLYLLGNGEDAVYSSIEGPAEALSDVLKKYLSTEICYDLEIGVRRKLISYPLEGKIHIVVSNTLSLAQLGKAENLPDHVPLIIHVDPKDQEILLKNETRAILSLVSHSSDATGDPFHSIRFNQFTRATPLASFRVNLTDNNVFIFHIWDLQQCLKIATLYRPL